MPSPTTSCKDTISQRYRPQETDPANRHLAPSSVRCPVSDATLEPGMAHRLYGGGARREGEAMPANATATSIPRARFDLAALDGQRHVGEGLQQFRIRLR